MVNLGIDVTHVGVQGWAMPKIERPKPVDLVATIEAAEILGKHVRTVHRLVADGLLVPATKVPGKTGAYMFRRSDVEALARQVGAAS